MGRFAKSKGRRGEQEVVRKLIAYTGLQDQIKRNLEQVHCGGADIYLPPYAIEVKRAETLSLPAWWRQACKQTNKRCPVPVLIYRANRKPWAVQLPAHSIVKRKFCKRNAVVTIDLETFAYIITHTLQKAK